MAAYRVIARKAALKRVRKAPERVQERFVLLLGDLAESGPFRAEWPNYSPLGDDRYHCHLGYGWVAC